VRRAENDVALAVVAERPIPKNAKPSNFRPPAHGNSVEVIAVGLHHAFEGPLPGLLLLSRDALLLSLAFAALRGGFLRAMRTSVSTERVHEGGDDAVHLGKSVVRRDVVDIVTRLGDARTHLRWDMPRAVRRALKARDVWSVRG
jgi:hypothetical protein